jgi:phosphoglycerate kinase
MTLPDIRKTDVAGRTVLLRADLNVPMQNGRVTDATRIIRFAPTVSTLLDRGASVVVMSHLGRPDGIANPTLSLQPVARALAAEIGRDVQFVPDCVGALAERVTRSLPPGEVVTLENLRFHPGEEADDRSFALMLSVHGDLYVNDAFSCSHRAHASTHAIVRLMPSFAGPSLLAEVEALSRALDAPERPAAALVGGSKVSTKIAILRHITNKVDRLIIGGGMANTFLAALGVKVGRSLYEPDAVIVARRVLDQAQANGCEVILPADVVVARELAANAPHQVVPVREIPADAMALDVGPATQAVICDALECSRTLLWNGPLGAFEVPPFGEATFAVARKAAELTEGKHLVSIAGGGDTAAALAAAGVAGRFTYLSTAGGAFLESIEGRTLPGILALASTNAAFEES